MTSIQSIWFLPKPNYERSIIMAKKSRKSSKKVVDVKAAQANDKSIERPTPLTPEQIITNDEKAATPAPAAPVSARTAAIRRSQAGKFNKVVLTQIGGAEAPKFYPWTWEQRDKFMASGTPEAEAVKARYRAHLATIATSK